MRRDRGGRRIVLPRWLRSARRRPAAFVAVLLLAGGAALVSAVTPMLLDALDAVALREGVAAAAFPANGVSVTAQAPQADDPSVAVAAVAGALEAAVRGSDRFGPPQQVTEALIVPRMVGPDREPFAEHLTFAPSGCAGLRVTGRCPKTVFEGLLPSSVARATGWTAGTRVEERVPYPEGGDPPYRVVGRLTVVGVYDETAGDAPAVADPTRLAAKAAPRSVLNMVIGTGRAEKLGAPAQVVGAVRVTRPVAQSDLVPLQRAVRAARQAVLIDYAAEAATDVRSGLDALLASIAAQQAASAVLVTPVGVEAVLLAWFALGTVAQRTARSRAAEWGVGRMRGARRRAWAATVFTEPTVAVLLGAVLGYAAALAVARAAAAALLGTARDVAPFAGSVLLGVGLAVAGSLVALVAASVRAALLPLPRLLQDAAEPRRLSRLSLVAQAALISVAAAVVFAALTTTTLVGGQLGLLLPAVLALVAGVAAVRIAVAVVRRTSRRAPRSLTGAVVGRGLARAPSVLVAAQLVVVSAAVAAFALQLGLLSETAQTDRAELVIGAPQVLSVQAPAGASLLDVVRRADPSGRAAMAAEQVSGIGDGPGGKVLAVDGARLAAVSEWRPSWRQGVDLARLGSSHAGLVLRGTRVQLDLSNVRQASTDGTGAAAVQVVLELARPSGWTPAYVGPLQDGRVRSAIPCADGCRLVSIGLYNARGRAQPWSAGATITGLATDRQPAAALREWLRADRWRARLVDQNDPARPARIDASASAGGLAITASDRVGSTTAQLEPAVGPATVPAVLGSEADLVPFPGVRGALLGTSLAGTPILVRPIGVVTAVPRALRTGVVVDLGEMLDAEDPALIGADQQVWLTADAPASVIRSLQRQGVRIISTASSAGAVQAALRSPTARAVRIAAVAALVAVGFGVLALVTARVVDLGERRRDAAVLRLVGVPARRLRRLALLRTAAPAVIGAVLGVVVGSIAAVLIAGRLPLFTGVPAGPVLETAVPVVPLAALAGALVLIMLIAAIAVTAAETRRIR